MPRKYTQYKKGDIVKRTRGKWNLQIKKGDLGIIIERFRGYSRQGFSFVKNDRCKSLYMCAVKYIGKGTSYEHYNSIKKATKKEEERFWLERYKDA